MCELNKTQIISPQTPSFKCPLAYILFILRIALSLGLYKICLNMRSHKEKMVESSEKRMIREQKISWLQTVISNTGKNASKCA
jgi:hypothetical protein